MRDAPRIAVGDLLLAGAVLALASSGLGLLSVPGLREASLAVAAFAVGNRLDPLPATIALVALILATYGVQVVGGGGSPPLLFVVAGPGLAAAVIRSRRELAAQLQATSDELEAERATFTALAVERERRYIARELHDVVGHAMSLIVIQAAAGRHLARTEPERAAEALEAIAAAGRQAQVEVARLHELSGAGGEPSLDHVPAVLAQAAAAGLQLSVSGSHGRVDLAPDVDRVACRVLQEALINVVRHADGADVDVRLEGRGNLLCVEVVNGPGRRRSRLDATDGGHGLRGMAERVRAVGGELEAGPRGGGWRVQALLPCSSPTRATIGDAR